MALDIAVSKHAPQQSIMHWKVRWPLQFICSYAPLVTQHYKHARNFSAWIQLLRKVRVKSKKQGNHKATPIINHTLIIEPARWPLRFICSYASLITQHYSQITVEETFLQWIHVAPVGSHFTLSQIDTLHWHLAKNWNKGGRWHHDACYVHSSCSWQKGTSWDKVTSNSEEIKPIAHFIVELCLTEGLS